MKPSCRVLALSGSLRLASSNTALLRLAGACAPMTMQVALFQGLGAAALPLVNPDPSAMRRALLELRRVLQLGGLLPAPGLA